MDVEAAMDSDSDSDAGKEDEADVASPAAPNSGLEVDPRKGRSSDAAPTRLLLLVLADAAPFSLVARVVELLVR